MGTLSTLYRAYGAVVYKQFIMKALDALIKGDLTAETNLPSKGRLTVARQEEKSRSIIHMLYGNTILRGGGMGLEDGFGESGQLAKEVEIIDELLPLADREVKLKCHKPSRVFLEPQHKAPVSWEWSEGWLTVKVESFSCHQMISVED